GGSVLLLFQAEDGIRAFHVTGVQTCALPIWAALGRENPATLAARDRSHELSSQILKKAPSGAFLVSACQPASHFLQTALPFEFACHVLDPLLSIRLGTLVLHGLVESPARPVVLLDIEVGHTQHQVRCIGTFDAALLEALI